MKPWSGNHTTPGNTWKIPWNDSIHNSRLQQLTTMTLDIGRFQWTRLPMGSILAQDVFQQNLDAFFLSVPGVTGIDDMIIFGKTDQEHNASLLNFLEFWKCAGRTT